MSTAAGKLFVVGVGPGDPDLISVKAARVLSAAGHVFVPLSKKGRPSAARAVIGPYLRQQCEVEELEVPMARDRAAQQHCRDGFERIAAVVRGGTDAVLVSPGDPATYSIAWPIVALFKACAPEIVCEIIPGITAHAAAAARAAITLAQGDETLSIVSAYDEEQRIERLLADSDTVVFLKTYLERPRIISLLKKHGLVDQAVYVQRSGLAGEAVISDVSSLPEQPEYLSLIIVRKRDG